MVRFLTLFVFPLFFSQAMDLNTPTIEQHSINSWEMVSDIVKNHPPLSGALISDIDGTLTANYDPSEPCLDHDLFSYLRSQFAYVLALTARENNVYTNKKLAELGLDLKHEGVETKSFTYRGGVKFTNKSHDKGKYIVELLNSFQKPVQYVIFIDDNKECITSAYHALRYFPSPIKVYILHFAYNRVRSSFQDLSFYEGIWSFGRDTFLKQEDDKKVSSYCPSYQTHKDVSQAYSSVTFFSFCGMENEALFDGFFKEDYETDIEKIREIDQKKIELGLEYAITDIASLCHIDTQWLIKEDKWKEFGFVCKMPPLVNDPVKQCLSYNKVRLTGTIQNKNKIEKSHVKIVGVYFDFQALYEKRNDVTALQNKVYLFFELARRFHFIIFDMDDLRKVNFLKYKNLMDTLKYKNSHDIQEMIQKHNHIQQIEFGNKISNLPFDYDFIEKEIEFF